MSPSNLKLIALTAVLLAGSVWAYTSSVGRGERFQRGQRLLPNLIPDEVATIEITKGDETTTLRKQGEQFTISELHDYPAKNESVNRFLHDLLEISLEKEVGGSTALAAELAIEPATDETIEVALLNASQQEMVRLRVGRSFDDGDGRYVRRLDRDEAPIYLTSDGVYISTDASSYIEKEIVDHSQTQIRRITGPDFVLAKDDADSSLRLQSVPPGKEEKSVETNKLKSLLDRLAFDKVFLADDAEVEGLSFDRELRFDLDDGTSYILNVASRDGRRFLRIRGEHDMGRVEIALDESEDELREKADQLTRADEIEDFNAFQASWVYELSSFVGDKLELSGTDLLDDA